MNNIEKSESAPVNNSKSIIVGQLSEPLKQRFVQLLEDLDNLRNSIIEKKKAVTVKSDFIRSRIEVLARSGKVHINEQEYNQSALSVTQYAEVLDSVCVELEKEGTFFRQFLSDNCPLQITVPLEVPDDFGLMVEDKIRATKRYIKTIGRDLLVSYSRYCHGFDAQIKRIDQVELLINNNG